MQPANWRNIPLCVVDGINTLIDEIIEADNRTKMVVSLNKQLTLKMADNFSKYD